MFVRVSAIFVLLAVAANADVIEGIKGVGSDVGDFFSRQFQSAKDLFSNDQSELEKNVERVKEMLNNVKEKMGVLKGYASDAQKETLNKVDKFIDDINSFQTKVKEDGSAKFEENKNKWQSMVTDLFDKEGLDKIIKMPGINSSASLGQMLSLLIAPIFYMLFVR